MNQHLRGLLKSISCLHNLCFLNFPQSFLSFSLRRFLFFVFRPKLFTSAWNTRGWKKLVLFCLLEEKLKIYRFLWAFGVESGSLEWLKIRAKYRAPQSLNLFTRSSGLRTYFIDFFTRSNMALCALTPLWVFLDFPSSKPGLHSRTDSKGKENSVSRMWKLRENFSTRESFPVRKAQDGTGNVHQNLQLLKIELNASRSEIRAIILV